MYYIEVGRRTEWLNTLSDLVDHCDKIIEDSEEVCTLRSWRAGRGESVGSSDKAGGKRRQSRGAAQSEIS